MYLDLAGGGQLICRGWPKQTGVECSDWGQQVLRDLPTPHESPIVIRVTYESDRNGCRPIVADVSFETPTPPWSRVYGDCQPDTSPTPTPGL